VKRKLSTKRNNELLGRKLQLLARDYYLSLGCRVDVAEKKVRWFPDPTTGRVIPRTFDHDFFGCWDLIVVQGPRRFFVQVTTLAHVSNKRARIASEKFPASKHDVILGWEKGRVFRVLRGPEFVIGEDRIAVPRPKKISEAEERREFAEVASYG